jgi:hypothetical protein
MNPYKKPTTVVLGFLGIAIVFGSLIINFETGIFGPKDLLPFISAIIFFSGFSIASKFNMIGWYLNPLFLSLLILVSFFIPLSHSNRWRILFIITICALLLHFKEIDFRKLKKTTLRVAIIFFGLKLLFGILSRVPEYILRFFSFGYDNAFHFAIYRYYRAEPRFPFGSKSPWATDFGLFKTYPSGQGALWSFLAEPIIGNNLETEKNLVAYAVINIVLLIILNFLVFSLIYQHSQKSIFDLVFIGFVSLAVSIGYFGIFFTNGFIPYAAGIVVVLIYLKVQSSNMSKTSRFLSVFFATLLLLLISPALIAFLFLPGLVTTFGYFKEAFSSANYMRVVFMLSLSCALALLGYFFQVVTSSNFGWRLILSPGGVIKPNVYVALLLFLTVAIALTLRWRSTLSSLIIQLVLSGAFSVILLSSTTIIFTGSVQYYAVKQLHVWLVLAAVGAAITLVTIKSNHKMSNLLRASFFLLLIVPLITPTSFRSPWMGNMIGVLSATLDKSQWDSQIVNVADIRSGLETVNSLEKISAECLILRTKGLESDLNSRWINALNVEPSITENCFSAFWNSAPLTDQELESRLSDLDSDFLILTDGNLELPQPKDLNYKYVQIGTNN